MARPFEIIQGETVNMPVTLLRADDNGQFLGFYDLTGVTEITTCFENLENQPSAELTKSLTGGGITILSAAEGKLNIAITPMESDVLNITKGEMLELAITNGSGDIDKFQIPNAYTVIQKKC